MGNEFEDWNESVIKGISMGEEHTKPVTMRIPEVVIEKLNIISKITGIPRQTLVCMILEWGLNNKDALNVKIDMGEILKKSKR